MNAVNLSCPQCGTIIVKEASGSCQSCGYEWKVVDGIPRFVEDRKHENFSLQWHRFARVQLDSVNGTRSTRQRLLNQSNLPPGAFAERNVLEVGCGAGRFTEVLLELGAAVVAIDYSDAVEVCVSNNVEAFRMGRLKAAQADVFSLPVPPKTFDIVVGYGMLQHTGDPQRALRELWNRVRPGGLLLVDRYQLSLRATHPLKYLLRPIMKRLPKDVTLSLAEAASCRLVPIQRRVLGSLRSHWTHRWLGYLINRSPNSTYPVHLEIEGSLSSEFTVAYSTMDTFDMWAPRFDLPQTLRRWCRDLESLESGEVVRCASSGQGNAGVVRRLE